jgi:arsenate reductase
MLTKSAGDRFEAESAGFEPPFYQSLRLTVMKEEGIDLSSKMTKSVGNLIRHRTFTVLSSWSATGRETDCPVFPRRPIRLHWDLENPEDFTGTDEEILEKVRLLKGHGSNS